MTKLILGGIAYLYLYCFMYGLPILVVLGLGEYLSPGFESLVKESKTLSALLAIATFVLIVILPSWRTRFAAPMYASDGLSFWRAHVEAGVEMRVNLRIYLAFLPVVGTYFDGSNSIERPIGLPPENDARR